MTTKVHQYNWDDRNISRASAIWAKGGSITDIATQFGISRSMVAGMIRRNRDKFEQRNPGGSNLRIVWTDQQIELAVRLWIDGKSVAQIATAMGLPKPTVAKNIYKHHKDKFPARDKPAGKEKQLPKEPVAEFIAQYDANASTRYDFTKYQIADTTPVPYWKLDSRQCHFPLERFEAVSGPETPCCGQTNRDGQSYCNTHWRLMHEVRVG